MNGTYFSYEYGYALTTSTTLKQSTKRLPNLADTQQIIIPTTAQNPTHASPTRHPQMLRIPIKHRMNIIIYDQTYNLTNKYSNILQSTNKKHETNMPKSYESILNLINLEEHVNKVYSSKKIYILMLQYNAKLTSQQNILKIFK